MVSEGTIWLLLSSRGLRNGSLDDIYGIRLKFCNDQDLDTEAIISHFLSSETSMSVKRLMLLIDSDSGVKVLVRWKGLPDTEGTLELLTRIYEDVQQMLPRLLERKNMPKKFAKKALRILGF